MKDIFFLYDSKDILRQFPNEVRIEAGFSLFSVQRGLAPGNVKQLSGLGKGTHGVHEIRIDHDKETYRVMYVAKLKKGVYVLCAFHKKSKEGKEIPPKDKELILKRYKAALEADSS